MLMGSGHPTLLLRADSSTISRSPRKLLLEIMYVDVFYFFWASTYQHTQLLRHENLALHGASNIGGAQFYPVCIQLTGALTCARIKFVSLKSILLVTGGGSLNPSGLSFPGAYSVRKALLTLSLHANNVQANDPGIHFNPYQGEAANKVCRAFIIKCRHRRLIANKGVRPAWWCCLPRPKLGFGSSTVPKADSFDLLPSAQPLNLLP